MGCKFSAFAYPRRSQKRARGAQQPVPAANVDEAARRLTAGGVHSAPEHNEPARDRDVLPQVLLRVCALLLHPLILAPGKTARTNAERKGGGTFHSLSIQLNVMRGEWSGMSALRLPTISRRVHRTLPGRRDAPVPFLENEVQVLYRGLVREEVVVHALLVTGLNTVRNLAELLE